LLAEFDFS
jgi:hypothetical protein